MMATIRIKEIFSCIEREHLLKIPKKLRLIMNAPDSGFIRFIPEQGKKRSRQMKMAPETGYEKELTLTEADHQRLAAAGARTHDRSEYFYFKANVKYGKGYVAPVPPRGKSNAVDRVEAAVMFRFQPDGSRNVETDSAPIDR